MQDYDDPSQVSFDFSNSKLWRPLFPTTSQPLASVQQELHYSETDLSKVQELRDRCDLNLQYRKPQSFKLLICDYRIERLVREHIMTLRSRFVTRWNRHCTRILQQLLPKLEENISSPPLHEHHTELNEITTTYKVSMCDVVLYLSRL